MTRKRFVKLVMSHGYSRNFAGAVADAVNAKGVSYSAAYDEFQSKLKIITDIDWAAFAEKAAEAAEHLGNVIGELVKVARAAAVAVSKAMEIFTETYRAELEKA